MPEQKPTLEVPDWVIAEKDEYKDKLFYVRDIIGEVRFSDRDGKWYYSVMHASGFGRDYDNYGMDDPSPTREEAIKKLLYFRWQRKQEDDRQDYEQRRQAEEASKAIICKHCRVSKYQLGMTPFFRVNPDTVLCKRCADEARCRDEAPVVTNNLNDAANVL